MLAYQILPATLRDLNGLRAIEKECFKKDAWPLLDLIAVLTFSGVVRLKVVADGRMVGFAAGDPRASEGIGWITTIGVIEAYRGKGIGAALLEICEQKMDMPVVRLCVRRSNAVAQHMYRKAGYLPTGMWNHYYEDGEDALVLQKERRPADLHS